MAKETKRLSVARFKDGKMELLKDEVVKEIQLTIVLDGKELVTLLCSPGEKEQLAVGFLFSEGLLQKKTDLERLVVDDKRGVVWVDRTKEAKTEDERIGKRFITTGCGKGLSFTDTSEEQNMKVKSGLKVSPKSIPPLMKEFHLRSETHKTTGGVHGAALCDEGGIRLFSEDIGRHSAIDKVLGRCLLSGIPMEEHLMIVSGRISSEILLKIARGGIPILVSKSAPSDLGVMLAKRLGITLVGFARGRRMNVYSNRWRIRTQG